MVGHFARLKLTLLASAFRRGWQQGLGLVFGVLFGVPLGLGAAVALGASADREWGGALLVLVYTLIAAAWAIGPLLLFGVDETLDPARLRLLPLTRRQLVAGLLAASAVGIGPLVTLLALAGAIPGYAPVGPRAALVVTGVATHLVLCLVLARALTTALSNRLRSRKGRDVTTVLIALSGLVFALMAQLPNLLAGMEDVDVAGTMNEAAAAVGWLPLAWPARGIVAAGEGEVALSLGWLAASALVVSALARWWSGSLQRAATSTEPAASSGVEDRDLYPVLAGLLPATRLGAAAAKELRYQWRVPQLRVGWLMLPVMSIGLIFAVAAVSELDRAEVVLVPTLLAGLQSFTGLNTFGGDRGAVWLLLASGGIQRQDLAGKNLATGALTLCLVVPTAVVLAALTGGWGYLPLTFAATISLLGILYAVGNLTSVLAPVPLPESGQNLFSVSSGMGCMTALWQMGAMLVGFLLAVPILAGVTAAVLLQPGLAPLAAVLAVLYSLGIWWGGLAIAANVARARGPEIVAALSG